MSKPENIEIGNIPAVLVRKPIKHVYIRIYPPEGRVVISAPERMPARAVSDFISSKFNWRIKAGSIIYMKGNAICLKSGTAINRPWYTRKITGL